jgi:retinol dehydrogenase 12
VTHPRHRVVLVTGANTGIGRAAALELARRGVAVVLASRDPHRNAAAAEDVRREAGHDDVRAIHLDLGSLASVRQAAADFLALGWPLHVLVNNAGVAGQVGRTDDGFERTFGVHRLGHFLLTQLLLERLLASAPACIVHVASHAHFRARGIDFDALKEPTRLPGLRAYQRSKLANVLFFVELARRLAGTGVVSYAVHPNAGPVGVTP